MAIPHSDRALVEDTTILVAKLPHGVTFTRIDDGDLTVDVRVVFMLAVNSDQGQLDTIAQVMDLIQNPELVQSVACAQSAAGFRGVSRLSRPICFLWIMHSIAFPLYAL